MSEEHHKKYYPRPKYIFCWYPFYSTKDGDDCLKKTMILSGYGGGLGTYFALMAGLTSTTPNNPALGSNIVMRLAKYGLPMFAAGGIFAASVCTVSNIRGGKDDPWNHFCAGLATGSVFGTAFKSQKLGWGLGFAFAFIALTLKAGKMEGFARINPSEFRRERSFLSHRRSYLVERPDPEGDPNI